MVRVVDFNAMPSKALIVSSGETSTQTVGSTAEQSGAPIALSSSSLPATGLSCHPRAGTHPVHQTTRNDP